MMNEFADLFAPKTNFLFKAKYRASCHCNSVQYEVCADPVDAKICHCRVCQKLHGAPMQWAAIFTNTMSDLLRAWTTFVSTIANMISMREFCLVR